MHPLFWLAAVALAVGLMLRAPLSQPAAIATATIVMIGGGLPHGAYDMALLRRAASLDRSAMALAVSSYAAIVALMALLWIAAPLLTLVLFLAVSAFHFGEDWAMLDVALLRFAAGAAVIAAAAIGHPTGVAALFVAMSDARAAIVAKVVIAAAPVALLVTSVGVATAWRNGNRQWAAAMVVCLAMLVALPPVAGFTLFFVFLHAPRHLAQSRASLRDMSQTRWLATGTLFSAATLIGWWAQQRVVPGQIGGSWAAQAFQLLASVAVPHLALSRWLEKRLERPHSSRSECSFAKASA
ncbi:Brp/Blh family beta-carotene 15,15'-dioxygenase [Novosphingobium sp.]|uniref:Brp/Blh family beta-carotene 15,15'-dioxygenase n=1 Tax=Novosphingobium sp. TaxID=1874826 RepID=UPI0025DD4A6D|nr:Brp/Blh family beta-carotene 15,15'-dioxygenase [Novosphingobium sp.]